MIDKGLVEWKVLQTVKNLAKTFEKSQNNDHFDHNFWINTLIRYGHQLNDAERKDKNDREKTI